MVCWRRDRNLGAQSNPRELRNLWKRNFINICFLKSMGGNCILVEEYACDWPTCVHLFSVCWDAEYVPGPGNIFWGKASKLQLLWNLYFLKCLFTVFGEQKFSMAPNNSVASGTSHNPSRNLNVKNL